MNASNLAAVQPDPAAIDRYDIVRRLKAVGMFPELADTICEVPRAEYVDPVYFEKEVDVLFRKHPVYVGLSAELPSPGDYKTLSIGGVPIMVVRGEDSIVRGFRNTCQHRGAPLLTQPSGSGATKMICQYHGWTYNYHGALVGIPQAAAFPGVDKQAHGLQPIQVQEKYGLIFAVIDKDAPPFDLEQHLCGIGPQLDTIGLDRLKPTAQEIVVTPTNWKLACDAFGESYHITSLHPCLESVLVGCGLVCDQYGPHVREGVPITGLKDILAQPESAWANAEAGVHFLFQYQIFPNVIITLMDGAVQIHAITPGRHVGEAVTTQTQAFAPDLPEEKRQAYAGFFHLSLHELTIKEDYPMAIGIYNALVAGSLEKTTLGRCEWPLHSLHNERRRLMEMAQKN